MILTPEICEAILRDHSRKPRYMGAPTDWERADNENPACGDMIHISLKKNIDNNVPVIACFEGAGCAASQSGASLILSHINNRHPNDVRVSLERFCSIMETGECNPSLYFDEYGEAAALFIFASNPARIKCATLGARLLIRMLINRTVLSD